MRSGSSPKNSRGVIGKRDDKQPKNSAPAKPQSLPVVGIGASAGGLEALVQLFQAMPVDTGLAFVIVVHQHPDHISLLPELLTRETRIEVSAATDGVKLERNHIYIAPPGSCLTLEGHTLRVTRNDKSELGELPIDHFFCSLAKVIQDEAVCIVLSGTGTDGTLGLGEIKAQAGLAIVQEPQSAKYAGMPSSAIATGLADYILAPGSMPKQLTAYINGPFFKKLTPQSDTPAIPVEPMHSIFDLLRKRTGHDFSGYKGNTLRRRIERRMNVHQIEEPQQYARFLRENDHEVDNLFRELLISVTSFFRDAGAWEALASHIEKHLRSLPNGAIVRAWIPGCATGEEVYSLAILLSESMEKIDRHFQVQLFGTDLDSRAIQIARTGIYPEGIRGDVSLQRLKRYFVHEDNRYRIRKELREMVIFAVQNVIKDPPFTKVDIITCRNLLIYLSAELQRKVIPIFHYALKQGGLLFLGASEGVGTQNMLFEVLDHHWKIYGRIGNKESVTYTSSELPIQPSSHDVKKIAPHLALARPTASQPTGHIQRLLLNRFVPTSLVLNDEGEIFYIHGHTGAYLEPAQGEPRSNALDMAREGLRPELAAVLRECSSKRPKITRERIRVKSNGHWIEVALTATRIEQPEILRGLILVTFQTDSQTSAVAASRKRKGAKKVDDVSVVEQLEREVRSLKESYQTTLEELETSNEELKVVNEELQSTNEEFQSANEELETSKEEMQSLNEELTTVNSELQSKLNELTGVNDDMRNLLNSANIATIFLDSNLNIKWFSDEAKAIIKVRDVDLGRPVDELVSNLEGADITTYCRTVLKELSYRESEIRTKEGKWYLMRILPYRTSDNVVSGVVLTFIDICGLKAIQGKLQFLSRVFQNALDSIVLVDAGGKIRDANEEAARIFGFSREELLGQDIGKLGVPGQEQEMETLLARCRKGEIIRNIKYTRRSKAGVESPVLLTLTPLTDGAGQADSIAIMTSAVSESQI